MRFFLVICPLLLLSLGALVLAGCSGDSEPVVSVQAPALDQSVALQSGEPTFDACWGQASKVFAKMGLMGEHASEEETPRAGLRNLARYLADAGVIPDDSMASLGEYVATEWGLDIDACMD